MRFGILHISDLHRDRRNEIENEVLLESLESDFRRFETQEPRIPLPHLCVVSGDLVYGVGLDTPNPEQELVRQHGQALDLLEKLCDRFFDGERERVVVLPGNHDVSSVDVRSSLTKIEIPPAADDRRALAADLFAHNSLLRWSWQEFCCYRITNPDQYQNRLRLFAETYHRFYKGARRYSLEPSEQWDIFDFDEVNLCVLGLNSCHRNDPFRRTASFHPAAIARACEEARAPARIGRLIAATWHHSLLGTPAQDDYLDHDILQNLISSGVSLGLHGHQHRPEALEERYRVGNSRRKICVVSAGTLCSGPTELPMGTPRSYNVIDIDTDDWRARVHQRIMVNRLLELPVWGPGRFLESDRSYLEISISPPEEKRPASLDEQLKLERVDELIGQKDWEGALHILSKLPESERAGPFRIAALRHLGDHARTFALLWPPNTTAEAVMVGGALLEVGSLGDIQAFLALDLVATSADASVREMASRLKNRALRMTTSNE